MLFIATELSAHLTADESICDAAPATTQTRAAIWNKHRHVNNAEPIVCQACVDKWAAYGTLNALSTRVDHIAYNVYQLLSGTIFTVE